jgi:hypothetical protein
MSWFAAERCGKEAGRRAFSAAATISLGTSYASRRRFARGRREGSAGAIGVWQLVAALLSQDWPKDSSRVSFSFL